MLSALRTFTVGKLKTSSLQRHSILFYPFVDPRAQDPLPSQLTILFFGSVTGSPKSRRLALAPSLTTCKSRFPSSRIILRRAEDQPGFPSHCFPRQARSTNLIMIGRDLFQFKVSAVQIRHRGMHHCSDGLQMTRDTFVGKVKCCECLNTFTVAAGRHDGYDFQIRYGDTDNTE